MRKVFMRPSISEAQHDDSNSINQIVLRLAQHLPKYGWEIVDDINQADLIASHAGQEGDLNYCDVAHCHGLYPTGMFDFSAAHYFINQNVVDSIMKAKVTTVPSQWVADLLAREMGITSEVIPWAVGVDEWQMSRHKGYSLWNKTRVDVVCDPEPIRHLARSIPEASFVSTYLDNPPPNVKITGRLRFEQMKAHIQNAALYIATTKETFGIGVLEAMACGQPILGYNWGAVPYYVQHGVNGFLAEPGNLDDLVNGWHYCMEHRTVLGQNSRKIAEQFTWDKTAEKIASVYDRVENAKWKQDTRKVSVVIPAHNYGRYLEEAVNSAMQQETTFEYDVIVVDDQSTDDTPERFRKLHKAYSTSTRARLLLHKNQKNMHVADTRNTGIHLSDAPYIVCLDADDRLGSPHFLQTLADYLDKNPGCGIAYTRLATFDDTDPLQLNLSQWPREASVEEQFMNHNQVPTCCMFRKTAWSRAGGYKKYAIPSEDAELWSRIMLQGFTANLVTSEPWFHYRWHGESLTRSKTNAAPPTNWLRFHPWAEYRKFPIATRITAPKGSWPVYNYDKPVVSIIIPVGPGHERLLYRALDSVYAQSFWNWECIVVNDTGKELSVYPWVKVWNESGRIRFGSAAKARNFGIMQASGPLVTFLDADDFWDNSYLSKTVRLYQGTGRYIYTDYVALAKNGRQEIGRTHEYDLHRVFNDEIIHTINILIPRNWLLEVQMFDESMGTWEDIDLFFKLASKGLCGKRLAEPLTYYDYNSGTLREKGFEDQAELKQLLHSRYSEYMEPINKMCDCTEQPKTLKQQAAQGDMVRIQFKGPAAPVTVIGASKQHYGRRSDGDFFWVWSEDQKAQPNKFILAPENVFEPLNTEIPDVPVSL